MKKPEPSLQIVAAVDLTTAIAELSDRDRIDWIVALLETISEEGTIGSIRDLVSDSKWDDQKP